MAQFSTVRTQTAKRSGLWSLSRTKGQNAVWVQGRPQATGTFTVRGGCKPMKIVMVKREPPLSESAFPRNSCFLLLVGSSRPTSFWHSTHWNSASHVPSPFLRAPFAFFFGPIFYPFGQLAALEFLPRSCFGEVPKGAAALHRRGGSLPVLPQQAEQCLPAGCGVA